MAFPWGGATVITYADAVIAPPGSVKLIGELATLICPRALTQLALSQMVAPLGTVFGNWIWNIARVVGPSK